MLFLRSEKVSEAQVMTKGLTLLPNEYGTGMVRDPESPPPEYGMPVDIIAVHGLNGHPSETWTHVPENRKEEKTFWLKDLLYRDLPRNVRVFTYGYDASVLGTGSTSTIRNIANHLAESLDTRASDSTGVAPRIILIGHSLGGLIIKRTIIMAKSNSNFQKLFEAIHGVIFLGTPHNGAGAANFANVLLKVIGPLARSNKGFLEALKRGSEELRSLTEDFRGFSSSNIQVISVCEKKRTGSVGIVVPEESATLNWGNHKERVLSFDCDHNHLAQYKADDSDYRILVRGIRKMVEQAAKGLQRKPDYGYLHREDEKEEAEKEILHRVSDIPSERSQDGVPRFVDEGHVEMASDPFAVFQMESELLTKMRAQFRKETDSRFLVAASSTKMQNHPLNLTTVRKAQNSVVTAGYLNKELTKEIYERVLKSIPTEANLQARRLFKWLSVVSSEEGLTVEEANSILAFGDECQKSSDLMRDPTLEALGRMELGVKNIGEPLIRVSREGTVGWYHTTSAEQHLCHEKGPELDSDKPNHWIQGWTFTRDEAKLDVALKCLQFLLFPDLQDPGPLGLCYHEIPDDAENSSNSSTFRNLQIPNGGPLDKEVEYLQTKYPLIRYISKHWAYHVSECESAIKTHHWHLIWQLAENPTGLTMAARLSWYHKKVKYRGAYPKKPTWIELFAYFGLTTFTMQLLEEKKIANTKFKLKGVGFTALQLAAMNGHSDLVHFFLEKKLLSLEDECSPTSLELSLDFGHRKTIKTLLFHFVLQKTRSDLDKLGPVAFELAIELGSKELIDLVLENGEDINCKLPKHGSVMEAAAVCGNEELAYHLISLGALANGKHAGNQYGHPFAAAAYLGRDSFITKLSCEWNGDINIERGIYSTALEAAATKKRTRTIQLLIKLGANKELVKKDEIKAIIAEAEMALEAKMALYKLEFEEKEEAILESRVRGSRPTWMMDIASDSTREGSERSKTTSIVRAKARLVGTMKKFQIAILTPSVLGTPIPLAALELAVRFDSRPMLNRFADFGTEILYTALHYGKQDGFKLLTNMHWIKGLRIPIKLGKPELIEVILARCLSHIITLYPTSPDKALDLVTCAIEMFLAITEDGNLTLMETMAILLVQTFETVLDKNKNLFYFRERLISKIHLYANRFLGHFQRREFHPMRVIVRTALLALIHALGKKCYMVVIRLNSIYLPILEEVLQPNADNSGYDISWLSGLTPELALDAMNDDWSIDIIRLLIYVGVRLCHAVSDPSAPGEMRAEANRFYYYASVVSFNAFAKAFEISQGCLTYLQQMATVIIHEDLKTSPSCEELQLDYTVLLESIKKKHDIRYRKVGGYYEMSVFEAVRKAMETILAEVQTGGKELQGRGPSVDGSSNTFSCQLCCGPQSDNINSAAQSSTSASVLVEGADGTTQATISHQNPQVLSDTFIDSRTEETTPRTEAQESDHAKITIITNGETSTERSLQIPSSPRSSIETFTTAQSKSDGEYFLSSAADRSVAWGMQHDNASTSTISSMSSRTSRFSGSSGLNKLGAYFRVIRSQDSPRSSIASFWTAKTSVPDTEATTRIAHERMGLGALPEANQSTSSWKTFSSRNTTTTTTTTASTSSYITATEGTARRTVKIVHEMQEKSIVATHSTSSRIYRNITADGNSLQINGDVNLRIMLHVSQNCPIYRHLSSPMPRRLTALNMSRQANNTTRNRKGVLRTRGIIQTNARFRS